MRVVLRRWVSRTGRAALLCADLVVPAARPGQDVVLTSAPDLDDNLVALLRSPSRPARCWVLVADPERSRRRASALALDLQGVGVVDKSSLRGVWRFLRSRTAICTHGLYTGRRPRRKQLLGLWHGEFGKLVGTFIGDRPHRYDWMPVSSQLSRSHRAAEQGLDPSKVHVVGLPRQELLREPVLEGRHLVFVPTYRATLQRRGRVDGDLDVADLLRTVQGTLGERLRQRGVTTWLRPHPMQVPSPHELPDGVRLATDAELEQHGIAFYELLASATCLVTDYSSVWVDFLLLDRPMISYCADLDAYRQRRGIALEPHEAWFPGPVVTTKAELLRSLSAVLDDDDADARSRAERRNQLHRPGAERASDEVWRAAGSLAR